jgi:hypothetical protein
MRLLSHATVRTAVNDLLLRQRDPLVTGHSLPVNPELKQCHSRKHMSHIIIPHTLHHWRQILLTPVVSVVGKVRNLDELLLVRNCSHNVVQLLELFFSQVGEFVETLDVVLVQLLLVVENQVVVCLVKYKSPVSLLNWRVLFHVLFYVTGIRRDLDRLLI